MADVELLPCPFCGGKATLTITGNVRSTRECVVKCEGCRYQRTDAALRYGNDWLRATAIAAWNRRTALRAAPEGFVPVPVDPTPEMVKAAEEAYMPFGDMELAIHMAIAASPQEVKE